MKDNMTWEDTIKYIRKGPEFQDLVKKAYFDTDLELNVDRFKNSLEFKKTKNILKTYAPEAQSILDVGCGNGISTINFAQLGYSVTAVEPDPSDTVGANAIRILKDRLQLKNIEIFQDFAEHIKFEDNSFDVVYIRQAMHHANNLSDFIKECVRVLKPNGLLLTIRDHVIFNEEDKQWFLRTHPLQKFYGGENAFTPNEYKNAFLNAGGKVVRELKYFDSVINYFPTTKSELKEIKVERVLIQKKKLLDKIGKIAKLPLVWKLYKKISGFKALNEKGVPGRMYSYIVIKK